MIITRFWELKLIIIIIGFCELIIIIIGFWKLKSVIIIIIIKFIRFREF